MLERWGIDPHLRSEQLSSGARTKVLLAAALARRPELIVLDEPCEGLDVEGVEDLWTSLMRRAGSGDGLGVILATNRIEDAERVCDRLVILDRGRLVLDGQLDDLRERWRRLILRLPEGTEDLGPLPGLVITRHRDGLIEATTSAWDGSLQQHLPDGAELVDAFPMALREIYLAVVGHVS
ncbi:MAG: ATP-binding cassette domain-containing protein [Gemmatimonadetes bacterium]|nr:ATP-binding cassette domain-containing protein [Gemmatimonadota bacterium]